MYKYLSIICALFSIVIFYWHLLPYSAWISLIIIVLGTVIGAIGLKKESNTFGKFSLYLNIVILIVFLLGLFVRIFIWNRP